MTDTSPRVDDGLPRITEAEALAGEWVVPPVSYVDPVHRFCAMTGRPIARRYWRVAVGEGELIFAGPAEALRYTTYPKKMQQTPAI